MPYPDFQKSVKCLDNKRLGKQRVEAFQILNTLSNGGGWRNHPAVKMWRGYENALRLYMNICIEEWVNRGFKNTMQKADINGEVKYPIWFGSNAFHASHRANLLRKDSVFYGKYGWTESPELPYVWPLSLDK